MGYKRDERAHSPVADLVPQHMEPTLAEKVSVLQRELNLSEGENFVDAVDNALEKIGLADELRGQPLTRKVDAALQTLEAKVSVEPMAAVGE